MIDVRFPTALQMMLTLAISKEEGIEWVNSGQLASGLDANPSFVRQLIVPLAKAGLVESARGRDGGVRIVRNAEDTTLSEIYGAMAAGKCLWASREVPHQCLVSSNFKAYFTDLTEQIQGSMLEQLGKKTLANSLSELKSLHAQRKRVGSASVDKANKRSNSKPKQVKGTKHV